MTEIEVSGVPATLKLNQWACANPGLLKVLQTYTNAIRIGGHIPDVESHIITELKKSLDFTVVSVDSAGDPPDEIF